jgi:hypothetical protein
VPATWTKLGRLCVDAGGAPWAASHAALPVADARSDGRHRVYFSARDGKGRAHIGWGDVDLENPASWTVSAEPAIGLGPLGAFDDSGVTSSCLVTHAGRQYHYYTGWSLGVTVPFYLSAGVAVSDDGGRTVRRLSPAPLLDRSAVDPFLTASPWVLVDNGTWRMWYVSATEWRIAQGRPEHRYHIRYAESRDGLAWDRRGIVCIDFASDDEYAIARPCVVRDGDVYRMWFSHRGDRYRIGYAESPDGIVWRRKDDEAGIDVSPDGWDSDMIEYPCVFDVGGRRLMLYNGNDYGRTGIGLAEWTAGTRAGR